MQNTKRSQTSQKFSKKQNGRGFNLQHVIINEETKQLLYLTPHSHSGMRKLTRQQRQIYEAHLKSKQQEQCQKYKVETLLKSKLAQQKQKDKYSRASDNYYIIAQKHQQKKNQKLKIFQMLEHSPLLQKKSKHSTKIQDQFIKQKQKGAQQLKAQNMQDSMVLSTIKLVDKLNQQQRQLKNSESIREIQRGYFDERFNNLDSKQDRTLQIVEQIYKKLTMSQPKQQKPSQIQQKLKNQLGQALIINSKLVKQVKQKDQLVRQRQNELKQLKNNYKALQIAYQQVNLQKKDSCKIQNLKFYSNLTIQNNISLFIKQLVQQTSNKQIKTARMIFKKDTFNTNIANYIDRPPFPVVILFTTVNKTIFGVFSQGIWTNKSNYKHQENTFKTIIFNATTKTIIANNSQTNVKCGLYYSDNYLIFGNHQLTLKNRDLSLMKVYGNSRFGERYFNLGKRQLLTGEVKDEIQIVEMQIFQVLLNDI